MHRSHPHTELPDEIKLKLAKKHLPLNAFDSIVFLTDDISDHAYVAYETFYQHSYPAESKSPIYNCNRPIHGLQHVGRVAAYVPILANLYRRYDDPEAKSLTEEDIKLLQITALFHDCAREGDGEDVWDEDSALFLYIYLTKTLGVAEGKAKLLAEAIANKDTGIPLNKPPRFLNITAFKFENCSSAMPARNIYQKILHDADCLDIRRVRSTFAADYLDFYQTIASRNPKALKEMVRIIKEIQFLIEDQGDGFKRTVWDIKLSFSQENEEVEGYKNIVDSIHRRKGMVHYDYFHQEIDSPSLLRPYQLLTCLYGGGRLLAPDELKLISCVEEAKESKTWADTINMALENGIVLARSIRHPSQLHPKTAKSGERETLIATEMRKVSRRPGNKTRMVKDDPENKALNKNGNPFRSASLLNGHGDTFGNVGFLIINPDMKAIQAIALSNTNTGYHKKKGYRDSS